MGNRGARESPAPGVVGLENFQNTCYMNAGIQCLAHVPIVVEECLAWELKHHLQGRSRKSAEDLRVEETKKVTLDFPIFEEFAYIVGVIWSGQKASIKPSRLKNAVDILHPKFKGVRNQHDAFEFLLDVLLKRIHGALRDPPVVKVSLPREAATVLYAGSGQQEANDILVDRMRELVVPNLEVLEQQATFLEPLCQSLAVNSWDYRMGRKGESVFTRHFYGQYKKTIHCLSCTHITVSFPTFQYLDLPMLEKEAHTDNLPLAELIARLAAPSPLDTACGNCGGVVGAKQHCLVRTTLWRLPNVLMVRVTRVLRREAKKDIKLNHSVTYPTKGLDLDQYLDRDSPYKKARAAKTIPGFIYDLIATLDHHGKTPLKGHYVAETVNHIDKRFYSFDDTTVTRVQRAFAKTASSAQVYIMFYQLRGMVHNWEELDRLMSELAITDRYQKISKQSGKKGRAQCTFPSIT